jgi:hypothetical protein
MAYAERGPLTDADGEFVRDLHEDDLPWFVRAEDFADVAESERFLIAREAFLRSWEARGVTREAFLPFAPAKPGFLDRVREAFREGEAAAAAVAAE